MSTQPGPTNAKPNSLPAGQFKIKTRKRAVVTKFEPQIFREAFLELLPSDTNNLNEYYRAVEASFEGKLDYKRYAEPFFELLIVGGLIAPGGIIVEGEGLTNPFSIFAGEDSQEAVRVKVDMFQKLIRRYKYLERKLNETLDHLLLYVNKFDDNTGKLSKAMGIFFARGMANMPILANLFKEHLIKDGTSLNFVTDVFKSYLKEQNMAHLTTALKKSGVGSKLIEFFPPNKCTDENLRAHFESVGLKEIVEHHENILSGNLKDVVQDTCKGMFQEAKTLQEIVTFIKEQMSVNGWVDSDIVPLLWAAFIEHVDWGTKAEQTDQLIIKVINSWGKVFLPFTTTPKTQLQLIFALQSTCYQDSRFLKSFCKSLQLFYKVDVLSETAILYWYEKAAGNGPGKTVFLKQCENFVQWLKDQEEESDDEDDED